jgi:hypothetical protein
MENTDMLDLGKLSAQDLALITRQTGVECELRFRRIAEASDPTDAALQDLLGEMAREARLQAPAEEEGRRPFGSGRRLTPEGAREFIRESLPSLAKGFGEGMLHRDIALFYA